MPSESVPPPRPVILPDLLTLAEREADQAKLRWEPIRPGVDIHWIYREGDDGAASALIRFQPGGRVGWHEHRGCEHIFVLSGSQTTKTAGWQLAPDGQRAGHAASIVSEDGCLVLAIYEKRVRFLDAGELTPG